MSENAHFHQPFPIAGIPAFMNFSWSLNFFSGFLFISTIYSIPACFLVYFMTWKFLKNPKKFSEQIRIEIFVTFLLMQHLNVIFLILEFIISRIPNSSLVTSYCAYNQSEKFLATVNFLFFTFIHAKNYVTVVFCLLRVCVLYSKGPHDTKLVHYVFRSTPFFLIFAILLAFPRLFDKNECVQLGAPFPFGSIMIMTLEDHSNRLLYRQLEDLSIPLVALSLIILTILMFIKLRQRRLLSTALNRKYDSKAEKTLSVTMLILLLPILMTQVLIFADNAGFRVFILAVLRPIFTDARAHVVTCYFYWTHPVFRGKKPIKIESCPASDKC